MSLWNLSAGDPLCLTLAADARLSAPDYRNDQIWELSLEGGEPPALTLQTTYGLRAGWMRLFPRFLRGGSSLSNPAEFAGLPRVTAFAPNALTVAFAPFPGIDVVLEYWVPASQIVAGRMRIHNNSILKESLDLEWNAVLNPLGQGESMAAVHTGSGYALRGKSEELFPVFVLQGAPQPVQSPFAGLSVELELFPGNERVLHWALASLPDPETALEQARRALEAPWNGEMARIHMLSEQHEVHITTGDPDWDAAFAFAQKTALGLFFPASAHLPQPSFVMARLPDLGHSPRGDGSDYGAGWNGQTALDAWYLSSLLLPGSPELARGLVDNFLAVQRENGAIDWKPGLAGQRGRHLAQPLLCSLAWQVGRHLPDENWLERAYPRLRRFLLAWLSPEHDRDGDGFPEWEHALQTGYEENPLIDRWTANAQGVDVTALESPSLPAFLYREVDSLMRIARRTGRAADLPDLQALADRLRAAVESCWDAKASTYRFRDRDTHRASAGQTVFHASSSGTFALDARLDQPERLLVHIRAADENTRTLQVTIRGEGANGALSEALAARQFFWARGVGHATGRQLFQRVTEVSVEGLPEADDLEIATIDFTQEAIPLLLPLWAGIPSPERAADLMDASLGERYLRPYGLPMCPAVTHATGSANRAFAYMAWNQLIGEGLLRYDRRAQAAELVTRLMGAVIPVLKQQRAFRQYYHTETGLPYGERNALGGLPPLGLFLQTLGIDAFTPEYLILSGFNPFPWPITVQYRGIRVTRQDQTSSILWPGGQKIDLDGAGPYQVSLA